MLTIFIGDLTLLLGFAVLLLPIVVTELSRPRDAFSGAAGLLLGLSLVTNNDRLNGGLMFVVVLGTFLIGRLGYEVAQSRWNQLDDQEKKRLGSMERWNTSFKQFSATIAKLGRIPTGFSKFALQTSNSTKRQKKWVRPEKNQQQQSSEEVETNFKEQLEPSNGDLQEQPQETLEGHLPPKDS